MDYIQLNSDRLGEYSGIWVSGVCSEDAEDMIDSVLILIKRGEIGDTWRIIEQNGRRVLERARISTYRHL